MIGVVYGTPADVIKLAPVLLMLRDRGAPAFAICTSQQPEQIPELLGEFDLPAPDLWLAGGQDSHGLRRLPDAPIWMLHALFTFARHHRSLRRALTADGVEPVVIIHGDTLTAVVGGLIGNALRVTVAHIEGGVNSGNWRSPFPEEVDRYLASRLSTIHYTPDPVSAGNLRAMHVRGEIVETAGNTVRDSLRLVRSDALAVEVPDEPFGLVVLHRFELLSQPQALREILEVLHDASRSTPMLFVEYPVTTTVIEKHSLDTFFDDRFRRVPRQRYSPFIALLKASAFLVTDSCGLQQESAQFGHPSLLHRAATFPEGRGGSAVLSEMNLDTVRAFLQNPRLYAREPVDDPQRPSDVIVDHLQHRGYLRALQPEHAHAA